MWINRWSDHQIALFSYKLHHLLEAGLPILDALKFVRYHWPKRKMSEYHCLLNSLQEGQPLSHALKRIRFPSFCTFLISVGEQHGQLSESLRMARNFYHRKHIQKHKQQKAMAYPLLLVGSVLCTLIIFLQFLLPQFLALYSTFHVPLPTITQWIVQFMSIADPLMPWLALGLTLVLVLFLWLVRTQRLMWEKVLFRLPWVSHYYHLQQTYMVCIQAGLLLEGGVTIIQICRLFQKEGFSLLVQQAFNNMLEQLHQGEPLSRVFQGRSCFLPVLQEMVLIAEQTGTLGVSLLKLGEQLESELDEWTERLSLFFESFITIGAGGLVLFLMMVLFVPLFHLINHI